MPRGGFAGRGGLGLCSTSFLPLSFSSIALGIFGLSQGQY